MGHRVQRPSFVGPNVGSIHLFLAACTLTAVKGHECTRMFWLCSSSQAFSMCILVSCMLDDCLIYKIPKGLAFVQSFGHVLNGNHGSVQNGFSRTCRLWLSLRKRLSRFGRAVGWSQTERPGFDLFKGHLQEHTAPGVSEHDKLLRA